MEKVLKIAFCLGTSFETEHVQVASMSSGDKVENALLRLQERGVLQRQNAKTYRWAYDCFQEAAYFLIPKAERAAFHSSLGRNLVNELPPSYLEASAFALVRQCSYKAELFGNEEKYKISNLCLYAGVVFSF
jgi:predicted ATPase